MVELNEEFKYASIQKSLDRRRCLEGHNMEEWFSEGNVQDRSTL